MLGGAGNTHLLAGAGDPVKLTMVLLGGPSSTVALSYEASQVQANLDIWVLYLRALLVASPTGPYIQSPALILLLTAVKKTGN